MIGDARNVPYRPPFAYPNDIGTPVGKSHKFQFFKKKLGNDPETYYTSIIIQSIRCDRLSDFNRLTSVLTAQKL